MSKEDMPWYGKNIKEEIPLNTVFDVYFYDENGDIKLDEFGLEFPMVRFEYSKTGASWAGNQPIIHYCYNIEMSDYVFERIANGSSWASIEEFFLLLTGKRPQLLKNIIKKHPEKYEYARTLRMDGLKEDVEGLRDFRDCDKNSAAQSLYYDRVSRFKFAVISKMTKDYRDKSETHITTDSPLANIIISPKE